jgi:hypothetical protein
MRSWVTIRKPLTIGLALIAWLATVIGFILVLIPVQISEIIKITLLISWVAIGLIVISFLLGRQIGQARSGQLSIAHSAGIIYAFRRKEIEQILPLNDMILQATSDIFFLGLSLPKLGSCAGILEDQARQGIHVRLLVPDPKEQWLVLAIGRFLQREEPFPRELSWFFNNFLPIWKRVPNTFEIRVHKQLPSLTASMFDGKKGFIEIYMYGWSLDDRLQFEVDFAETGRDYKENLNRLWNEATPLNTPEAFIERINAVDEIIHQSKQNHP